MRKILASVLVFFLAFFTLSATKVSAKVLSSEKGTVTVAKGEVVNDDLFIGAQTAEIDGVVNGDVFIGAQTVKLTGIINGSLHVGSQNVDLAGTVKGNAYIGAQNVSITGLNIGGSLLVGSQDLNIDKTSVVGGSILAGGATVKIDSQVKRNVFAGTGMLTIGDNTKIGKDLFYASTDKGQVNISEKAVVAGTIHKSEAKVPEKEVANLQKLSPKLLAGTAMAAALGAFLASLIVAFLYYKFFGKQFSEASSLVTNSFWKSLGIGFLIIIALIPGLIILLITMIGIPVAGLSFLLFLIYSYLSKIVVGASLGNWISKRINWKMSVYGACSFGLLTIFIVQHIPFIGGLFGFVVFLTGLGALTINTFAKAK